MIIGAYLGARQVLTYFFKKEGRPVEEVETFSFYVLISCMIGARLGEVLFYTPAYYLKHPLEAILPFEFSPTFRVVGYKGLSYHGALVGGIIGTFLYSNFDIQLNIYPFIFRIKRQKRPNQPFLWLLTPLALSVMMGFLIRIGNFINSEIIGTPTHSTYGVFFARPIVKRFSNLSKAVKTFHILKDTTSQPDAKTGYQPILLQYTFANTGVSETDARNFVTFTLSAYLQFNLDSDRSTIGKHIYVPNPASLDYSIIKNKRGQYMATVKAFAIPRHPVQLYESFAYLITLITLLCWWNLHASRLPDGILGGIAMVTCYAFRFFLEFFKEPFNVVLNIVMESTYPLTMGHVLSLFTVWVGVGIIITAYYQGKSKKPILFSEDK
jgi:phosphatidylglycerol:prolipoprotein diacylglycerol transferase